MAVYPEIPVLLAQLLALPAPSTLARSAGTMSVSEEDVARTTGERARKARLRLSTCDRLPASWVPKALYHGTL